MKYLIYFFLSLKLFVGQVLCYKTYSSLDSIVFTNIDEIDEKVHSEYFYGKCAAKHKTLALRDHYTYENIKGKILIRGYLNASKEINCVYVRSESQVPDMVKYKPTRFTMCLSKIRYQYTGHQFYYYFYEWFLPVEMRNGMDWDVFFFY